MLNILLVLTIVLLVLCLGVTLVWIRTKRFFWPTIILMGLLFISLMATVVTAVG